MNFWIALNVWTRYCLFWNGLPAIGNPKDADVIIVQAFGRNNLEDEDLEYIYDLRQEKVSDLKTLESLRSHAFDPGKPNYSLANETIKLMKKYGLPAIVQWEVAVALLNVGLYDKEKIFCIWPPENCTGFNTLEVKEETFKIMKKNNWSSPLELAHKRQITRAFLIVKNFMEANKFSGWPVTVEQETDCFDSKSIQKWTTGPLAWYPKEFLVRIHHWIFGWV